MEIQYIVGIPGLRIYVEEKSFSFRIHIYNFCSSFFYGHNNNHNNISSKWIRFFFLQYPVCVVCLGWSLKLWNIEKCSSINFVLCISSRSWNILYVKAHTRDRYMWTGWIFCKFSYKIIFFCLFIWFFFSSVCIYIQTKLDCERVNRFFSSAFSIFILYGISSVYRFICRRKKKTTIHSFEILHH